MPPLQMDEIVRKGLRVRDVWAILARYRKAQSDCAAECDAASFELFVRSAVDDCPEPVYSPEP